MAPFFPLALRSHERLASSEPEPHFFDVSRIADRKIPRRQMWRF
jgi:hypothetical protein